MGGKRAVVCWCWASPSSPVSSSPRPARPRPRPPTRSFSSSPTAAGTSGPGFARLHVPVWRARATSHCSATGTATESTLPASTDRRRGSAHLTNEIPAYLSANHAGRHHVLLRHAGRSGVRRRLGWRRHRHARIESPGPRVPRQHQCHHCRRRGFLVRNPLAISPTPATRTATARDGLLLHRTSSSSVFYTNDIPRSLVAQTSGAFYYGTSRRPIGDRRLGWRRDRLPRRVSPFTAHGSHPQSPRYRDGRHQLSLRPGRMAGRRRQHSPPRPANQSASHR